MTTGRINQVRTIRGRTRTRRAPPARVQAGGGAPTRARPRPSLTPGPLALRQRARGLSPVQAASDAPARLPAPRRSMPRAGLGAELPMRGGPLGRSLASPRPAPPSASAQSRRLQTPGRVSPRLRGACLGPGWGPSCPCGVAPSGARSPAPGLRRTASPPPSGSHVRSAGASMRQAVARPSVLSGCVLRLGRRRATCRPQPAHFPWDGRRSPHAPGPSRRDGHQHQDTDAPRPAAGQGASSARLRSCQRPCHHALCMLTRRGCPILYVPAQCAPAKTEALLPSHFWEGRSVGRAGRRAAPVPGVATGRGTLADGRGGGMHLNRGYQSRL